jgi:hypothetical protein
VRIVGLAAEIKIGCEAGDELLGARHPGPGEIVDLVGAERVAGLSGHCLHVFKPGAQRRSGLADRLAAMGEEQPHRLVDIDMGGIVVLDGAPVAHFPMADHVAERADRPADAGFEETDFERGSGR